MVQVAYLPHARECAACERLYRVWCWRAHTVRVRMFVNQGILHLISNSHAAPTWAHVRAHTHTHIGSKFKFLKTLTIADNQLTAFPDWIGSLFRSVSIRNLLLSE